MLERRVGGNAAPEEGVKGWEDHLDLRDRETGTAGGCWLRAFSSKYYII